MDNFERYLKAIKHKKSKNPYPKPWSNKLDKNKTQEPKNGKRSNSKRRTRVN